MFPENIPKNLLDYNPQALGSKDIPFYLFLPRDVTLNLPHHDTEASQLIDLDAIDFDGTRYASINHMTLEATKFDDHYSIHSSIDTRLPENISQEDFIEVSARYQEYIASNPVFPLQTIKRSEHPSGVLLYSVESNGRPVVRVRFYKKDTKCKIRISQEFPSNLSTDDNHAAIKQSVAVLAQLSEGIAKTNPVVDELRNKAGFNIVVGATSRGTASNVQLALLSSLDTFNGEHGTSIQFGPDTNGGKLNTGTANPDTIAHAVLEIVRDVGDAEVMQTHISQALPAAKPNND